MLVNGAEMLEYSQIDSDVSFVDVQLAVASLDPRRLQMAVYGGAKPPHVFHRTSCKV